MSKPFISVDGVVLPSPVGLTINDELIWSADTGRTLSGKMVGRTIAKKKNINVKWEMLTSKEVNRIEGLLRSGFFSISVREYSQYYDDGSMLNLTVYRGTIAKEELGIRGEVLYYKTVSVDLIER